ncbi:MAG: lactate utilization protein [Oligoflexia bacterium]|nr:lactate utilization protein [Oligoflexia bacterium]
MDEHARLLWEEQAQKVIKNLRQRHMDGVYCRDRREALDLIIRECKPYSPISWGGSITLDEIGIREALRSGGYDLIDQGAPGLSREQQLELRRKSLHSDLYITSTNAITIDGELVNIDGFGNRVAAMIYGPNRVFVVAGMNKLVYSVDEAVSRIKNFSAPANAVRLDRKTPCRETTVCEDCRSDVRMCCHLVVTSYQSTKDRVKVFLVGESLGY